MKTEPLIYLRILNFFMFGCRERALAQERAEKERQEMERKKERDQQLKKEMEKIREQV